MSIQVIDDPQKVKLLGDETRQKIMCILGKSSLSISGLARALSKTPATIFYHIKKLESANLIKVEKTEVVNNNLVEKYYSLSIPSCLIGLRVVGPERGPVPPRKLIEAESRTSKLCPSICWDDVFTTLGLKLEGNRKQRLVNVLNQILERAILEAGQAYEEAMQQIKINIRLPSQDQRKLQKLASTMPILTFCRMLEKPENLNILKDLLWSLPS